MLVVRRRRRVVPANYFATAALLEMHMASAHAECLRKEHCWRSLGSERFTKSMTVEWACYFPNPSVGITRINARKPSWLDATAEIILRVVGLLLIN